MNYIKFIFGLFLFFSHINHMQLTERSAISINQANAIRKAFGINRYNEVKKYDKRIVSDLLNGYICTFIFHKIKDDEIGEETAKEVNGTLETMLKGEVTFSSLYRDIFDSVLCAPGDNKDGDNILIRFGKNVFFLKGQYNQVREDIRQFRQNQNFPEFYNYLSNMRLINKEERNDLFELISGIFINGFEQI